MGTTSFVCEHTAEFSLVPYLKSLLEHEFDFVLPIFPWLSRELAGKSHCLHKNFTFRVLVLFPRRPKVSDSGQIFVTINEELRAFKTIGDQYGVPVLAGCPRATDFWSLSTCIEQVWIDICHETTREYLVPIDSMDRVPGGSRLFSDDVLAIAKRSNSQTMDTLEDFVRCVRHSQPVRNFGGCYKPVYFLMA